MRISDWSSDVCSSDLHIDSGGAQVRDFLRHAAEDGGVPALQSHHALSRQCRAQKQVVDTVLILAMAAGSLSDRDAVRMGRDQRQNACAYQRIIEDNVSLSKKAFRLACQRSEEHTSELQSLMRISYAVFCLKKKN